MQLEALLVDQIVEAWQKWDSKPTSPETAAEMANRTLELADWLKCSPVEVRLMMAGMRRDGLDYREIVETLAERARDE